MPIQLGWISSYLNRIGKKKIAFLVMICFFPRIFGCLVRSRFEFLGKAGW